MTVTSTVALGQRPEVRSGQVRSGQVYYSAKICDHESHKEAWATSKVSTGLNLATLEYIDVIHWQHSLCTSLPNDVLCHYTSDSESVPKNVRAVATSGACACSLCLLNHRFHRLSIFNAVLYRVCVSDHCQENQIDDT